MPEQIDRMDVLAHWPSMTAWQCPTCGELHDDFDRDCQHECNAELVEVEVVPKQQARGAVEALRHTTQLVREEVNAARSLGDTEGEWWDRATSALTAADAVLGGQ